jgi:hypothetical protein
MTPHPVIAFVLGLVLLMAGPIANMAMFYLPGPAIILIAAGRWLQARRGRAGYGDWP